MPFWLLKNNMVEDKSVQNSKMQAHTQGRQSIYKPKYKVILKLKAVVRAHESCTQRSTKSVSHDHIKSNEHAVVHQNTFLNVTSFSSAMLYAKDKERIRLQHAVSTQNTFFNFLKFPSDKLVMKPGIL